MDQSIQEMKKLSSSHMRIFNVIKIGVKSGSKALRTSCEAKNRTYDLNI